MYSVYCIVHNVYRVDIFSTEFARKDKVKVLASVNHYPCRVCRPASAKYTVTPYINITKVRQISFKTRPSN